MFSLIDHIVHYDRWAVWFISQQHTPWLDQLMYNISTFSFWLPLYLTIAVLLYMMYGKKCFRMFMAIGLVLGLVSILGSEIIKPIVGRPRPTYCSKLRPMLNLVVKPNGHLYFGGHDSYPSGHAANAFALIMLSFYYLKQKMVAKRFFLAFGILYVLTVSFSRIYLCVHFPTDIVGGWLLAGIVVACVIQGERRAGVPGAMW